MNLVSNYKAKIVVNFIVTNIHNEIILYICHRNYINKKEMDFTKFPNSFVEYIQHVESNLSVDSVIFTIQEGKLKVLLTQPMPSVKWMVPGGFMHKNEEASAAAHRSLKGRTGVEHIYLHQFKIFSKPDRFSFQKLFSEHQTSGDKQLDLSMLPERVISIGFFALVNFESIIITGGEHKEATSWTDIKNIPDLMFDHNEIVQEAVEALRKELYFKPIAYNLLPEKFTMPELQNLYEIIFDKSLERSSFQKKMLKWNIYERLEERREGVAHKRPFLYKFDKDKYEAAIKQGIRFGV